MRVRQLSAFLVDFVLHTGIAVVVFVAVARVAGDVAGVTCAAGAYVVVSFLHRTLFQWYFHATIGKLTLGLVAVRPADGGPMTFGALLRLWGLGIVLFLYTLFGSIPDTDDLFHSVRRRDLSRTHDHSSSGPSRRH